MKQLDLPTIEELAKDAFHKLEYAKALATMNVPLNFKERQKAFIELALARKSASEADTKLETAIHS